MSNSSANKSLLCPAWFPLLLALLLIVLLLLLFPGERLKQTVIKARPDQTSMAYLRAMLAEDPQSKPLREQLVKHYVQLGRTEQALHTLTPLVLSAHDSELRLWQGELLMVQFFALPEGDPSRQELQRQLRLLLEETLAERRLSVAQLERLADWSRQMGWNRLAAEIYLRLSEEAQQEPTSSRDDPLQPLWAFLFTAAHAEGDSRAVEYALKGLDSLLAADEGTAALNRSRQLVEKFPDSEPLLEKAIAIAAAQGKIWLARDWGRRQLSRFGRSEARYRQQFQRELAADETADTLQWLRAELEINPESVVLLEFAVKIARSSGDGEAAKLWGRHLVELQPQDELLQQRQIELEMGSADLRGALKSSQTLLQQRPQDRNLRREVARIAEWAGEPRLALQQWRRLAKSSPDGSDAKRALMLARQLNDHQTIIDLLSWRSRRRALSSAECSEWIAAYEALGLPQRASAQLKQLIKRYPARGDYQEQLAQLYERRGDLAGAAAVRADMGAEEGVDVANLIKRTQLLLQINQLDEALALLESSADSPAVAADHRFWRLYGRLAWELGDDEGALRAYGSLWESAAARANEGLRYLSLQRMRIDSKVLIGLYEEGWRRFATADYILTAMELAHEQRLWDKLSALLDLVEQNRVVTGRSRYWSLRALVATQQGAYERAAEFLQQALRIDPRRRDYQAQQLWLLIEFDKRELLTERVAELHPFASRSEELWWPMAVAYLQLQRPKGALVWYQKLLGLGPSDDDYLLQLSYAEALQKAGYLRASQQFYRYTLLQLRPKLQRELLLIGAEQQELIKLQNRIPLLLSSYLGDEMSSRWLRALLQSGQSDPRVQEIALNWYLSSGYDPQARYWLLRHRLSALKEPLWIRLALLLKQEDRQSIEKLLEEESEAAFNPLDRIAALRAVGRDADALQVALTSPSRRLPLVQRPALGQQLAELSRRLPQGAALTQQQRDIGDYVVESRGLHGITSMGSYSFSADLQSYRLSAPKSLLDLSSLESERLLQLEVQRRWLQAESSASVALLQRPNEKLYPVVLSHQQRPLSCCGWGAALALNEVSDESSLFRLLGVRDRLSLSAEWHLNRSNFALLQLHQRRYKSWKGSELASGWGGDLQLNHRFGSLPQQLIQLYASQSETELRSELPQELSTLLPNGSPALLLAERYRETGLNWIVQRGEAEPWGNCHAGFYYRLELGGFRTEISSGYRSNLMLGVPLLGPDDLQLDLSYSDATGGVDSDPLRRVALRYSYRFD